MTPELHDAATCAEWLAEKLETEGVDYAIGGALGLAPYGVSRMTVDVDVSVYLADRNIERLFDVLERAGCLFARERATAQIERANLFRVRCGKVNVDLFVAFHSHDYETLGRRLRLAAPSGRPLWFLSAEDQIVHKLALNRKKDAYDLELLFAAQGAKLDLGYIRRWIERITEPGDARREALEELAQRFARQ
jgi:hypothetical protein